jgi:hypothetical protein
MKRIKSLVKKITVLYIFYRFLRRKCSLYNWAKDGFNRPSPWTVKHSVLNRYSLNNSTWIETGTFHGETTKFLSRISNGVISIEPDETLYSQAVSKFLGVENIVLINSTSEEVFDHIVGKLSGNVNFWLDGHYSGPGTFKATQETPIVFELNTISKYRNNFQNILVLIDDFRLFSVDEEYPKKEFLVEWANLNGFSWTVEHDIFIISSSSI